MANKILSQANNLRKKVKFYEYKGNKVLKDWAKQPTSPKTSEHYSKKLSSYEKKMDAAYSKYSAHIDKNFNRNQIVNAGAYKGKFLNKSFLNNLKRQGGKK